MTARDDGDDRVTGAVPDDHESRFRALTDAAPVLVWLAGLDRGCDWFNQSWLGFTGRSLEEELGFGWTEGVHPDDSERRVATYVDAFDVREPFETEYRLRRHDGAYRWVLDRGVPRFDPDGEFAGYIGSCVDIDDIKTAEWERAALLEAERRAREETERVARRLARLQRATAAFARALTPDEVYETVVREAVAAAGADAGVVCTYDPSERVLELARAVGYPAGQLEQFVRFGIDLDVPIAEAVREQRPVLVPSLDELVEGYEVFRSLATASGRRSAASLPLLVDGLCLGALGLSFGTEQPFDIAQRAFLDAIAAQAAAALQRTQLWEAEQAARAELERAHERLIFLTEATEVTASTLDRSEIVWRACQLAVPRIADLAVAYLQEGSELRRMAVAHADPERQRQLESLVDRHSYPLDADAAVARAWRTKQLLHFASLGEAQLAGAPAELREALLELRPGRALVVPIVARDHALGVLALASEGSPDTHAGDDVTVAVELANRVAAALDNAVLYEREHAVAVQLQRSVLPQRLPEDDRLEIAARYLPASAGVLVGGDWYDAFPLRDGRFGLAVGDVAGHGVLAAATMGQLRNALRAYASEGAPPAAVLGRLSQLVADDGDAVFATATYASYDPRERRLQWANAGHVPALLLTADGPRYLVAPADPILGVAPRHEYGTGEVTLGPGDLVLWYTDGLVERRYEDLGVGLDRLARTLSGAEARTVEEVCDGVLQGVVGQHSHGDDICLLAMRPT